MINPAYRTLPCGCQFGSQGDAFIFVPHAFDCPYYQYFLEESARQAKPVVSIEMQGES